MSILGSSAWWKNAWAAKGELAKAGATSLTGAGMGKRALTGAAGGGLLGATNPFGMFGDDSYGGSILGGAIAGAGAAMGGRWMRGKIARGLTTNARLGGTLGGAGTAAGVRNFKGNLGAMNVLSNSRYAASGLVGLAAGAGAMMGSSMLASNRGY